MRKLHWLSLFAVAVALGNAPAAQQAPHPAPAAAHAASAPATPTTPKAIGSIKEIMDGIVDPTAEVLFDAVSYESTAAGITQIKPTTDEDWAKVRRHALLLAEVTNLLRMPGRRVAPANPFLELEKDEGTARRSDAGAGSRSHRCRSGVLPPLRRQARRCRAGRAESGRREGR